MNKKFWYLGSSVMQFSGNNSHLRADMRNRIKHLLLLGHFSLGCSDGTFIFMPYVSTYIIV